MLMLKFSTAFATPEAWMSLNCSGVVGLFHAARSGHDDSEDDLAFRVVGQQQERHVLRDSQIGLGVELARVEAR